MNPIFFSLLLFFSAAGLHNDAKPQDGPTCPPSLYDVFHPVGNCSPSCECRYEFLGLPGQTTVSYSGTVNGFPATFTIGSIYTFPMGTVICFPIPSTTTPCCFVTACP